MILVQVLLEGWEVRGDTEKTYGKGSGPGRGSASGNYSWWVVASCPHLRSEDGRGRGEGKSCGKGNESPWLEVGSSACGGGGWEEEGVERIFLVSV
jgi:hypothetical protein